jgi:hypothetical protein
MSVTRELLVEAYLDGTLDAAGADELAAELRGGGAEAARIRAEVAFAGLLGQALDAADGDAVARAVDERIVAEGRSSAFVRRVQGALPARARQRRPSRSWPLIPLAAMALVLALAGWWALRPGVGIECRITALDGAATIVRAGLERPAAVGAALVAGETVVAGASATVTWADGTALDLAAGTRLLVGAGDAGKRVDLVSGGLTAEVAPQPAGRPFVLATANARVAVVGTRFTLSVGAGRTRIDLIHGAVRFTRSADGRTIAVDAGEGATVAAGEEFAAAPSWRDLFPASGFAGWERQHGEWVNAGGVLRGSGGPGGKARLLGEAALGDLELTCRVRLSGVDHGEVQVGDYNWFFTVPGGAGRWVAVHLTQQGEELRCTADGVALEREPGAAAPARRGPLAFYVMPGGTIEIADARIRVRP